MTLTVPIRARIRQETLQRAANRTGDNRWGILPLLLRSMLLILNPSGDRIWGRDCRSIIFWSNLGSILESMRGSIRRSYSLPAPRIVPWIVFRDDYNQNSSENSESISTRRKGSSQHCSLKDFFGAHWWATNEHLHGNKGPRLMSLIEQRRRLGNRVAQTLLTPAEILALTGQSHLILSSSSMSKLWRCWYSNGIDAVNTKAR